MTAELKETLELVRTLDRIVTFSENHCATMPVRAAAKRVRESLIGCLRNAVDDLAKVWPTTDQRTVGSITESLEHGEIPAATPGYVPLLDAELTKLEARARSQKIKQPQHAA